MWVSAKGWDSYSRIYFDSKIKTKPCSFTNCLLYTFRILEAGARSTGFSDRRNPSEGSDGFAWEGWESSWLPKQRKNTRHTSKNSFSTHSGWVRLLQDAALTDLALARYRPSGRTRAGLSDGARRSAGCWHGLGTVSCSQLIAKCLLPKHHKSQQQQLLTPEVILVTWNSASEFSNTEITEISKKRKKNQEFNGNLAKELSYLWLAAA